MAQVCQRHNVKLLTYGTLVSIKLMNLVAPLSCDLGELDTQVFPSSVVAFCQING